MEIVYIENRCAVTTPNGGIFTMTDVRQFGPYGIIGMMPNGEERAWDMEVAEDQGYTFKFYTSK